MTNVLFLTKQSVLYLQKNISNPHTGSKDNFEFYVCGLEFDVEQENQNHFIENQHKRDLTFDAI